LAETSGMSSPNRDRLDRKELRLALQRLAAGYYNRPEVLMEVARRIIALEDERTM
jgi:hypothetical protein